MNPEGQSTAKNQQTSSPNYAEPMTPTMPAAPVIMPPKTPSTPVSTPPIAPTMQTQAPSSKQNGEKKVGPIIATLVIVLILIIAALYLFASRINQPAIPDDSAVSAGNLDGTTQSDGSADAANPATATIAPITNTSTDVNSLKSDLNNATNGLDNQNF